MKKKIIMAIAITILSFIPFANVNAEGTNETMPTINRGKIEVLHKSDLYAGEIFVDGQSQMQWLYSPNIPNTKVVFGYLKAELYDTNFYDLVPELSENLDIEGLAVSTSHQSEMNSNWTSASYVANQYYTGNIGPETNRSLLDDNRNLLSTISVSPEMSYETIDGVLTRVVTVTYFDEETTMNYTKVDITTSSVSTYKITFDTNDGNPVTTQTVTEGSIATIPSNPTREGYEFMYWSSNTGKDVSERITSDTTFTAEWIRKFNIKQGSDQTFYLESGKDIIIIADGPIDEFTGFAIFSDNKSPIYMDDLTEGKDYIIEEGSTKLTLKNSFLKTLGNDKYYVEFYYNNPATYGNGYTDTTLLINEGSEPLIPEVINNQTTSKTNNPQTGDNILFYISVLGLSIFGLAGLYIKKRLN